VFEIHEDQVWKIQSTARKKSKTSHRPLALLSEQEDAVVALIETGYHQGNFPTHGDGLNFVLEMGLASVTRLSHPRNNRDPRFLGHFVVNISL
jgi:hypothetical protein